MTYIGKSHKKPRHPEDVNSITRAKRDRLKDRFDRKRFEANFASIEWKSKRRKT